MSENPVLVEKAIVLQIAVNLPGDDPDDPWEAPEGMGFVVIQMPIEDVRRMPMFSNVRLSLTTTDEAERKAGS